jgi:hypothetical protein
MEEYQRRGETMGESFSRTFGSIGRLLKLKEFYLPLTFFLVQGLLLPNFDELHYIFLTQTLGMPKWEYDYLNTLTFLGVLFFTAIYNQCCPNAEVWILILISLVLFIVMTSLMLIDALRINADYGMSEEWTNALILFLGTQSISTLAYLPVCCILTMLVPANVEASVMALVAATFVWSYEVGARISASIFCLILEVDSDHMENYPRVLEAKLFMILLVMALTIIIPNNESIYLMASQLKEEREKSKQEMNENQDSS